MSPVTRYLAIEPGVRPSTEGLDDTVGEGFGAGGLGFSVQLETTYQEIVDVLLVEVRGASDLKLGTCLAEAVWKLELPEEFRATRASYGLDV